MEAGIEHIILKESHAGIDKEVVSVGVFSRVEIWSKERYQENSDFDDMDEIAEHMADLGIGI